MIPCKSTLLLLVTVLPISCFLNCASNFSNAIGCLSCDVSTPALSITFNASQLKYTCIADPNCATVTGSVCSACISPYVLNTTALNMTCVLSAGCLLYNNVTQLCDQCDTNYLLVNGTCFQTTVPYCTSYTVVNSSIVCTLCAYSSLSPASNCTVDPALCSVFDFSRAKCIQCPTGTELQSSGQLCYTKIAHCLWYDQGNPPECIICETNYIYFNGTCLLNEQKRVSASLLTTYSLQTSTYNYLCLDNRQYFNISDCAVPLGGIAHCTTVNGTDCSNCFPGYYLSANKCLECAIAISNCAICSSSASCTVCQQGYYLLNISTSLSKCMSCSSFGCLECSTKLNSAGKVECLSCPANRTLYLGSCMSCQDSTYAFSIPDAKCLLCNQTNCLFCKFTATVTPIMTCLECVYGFYLNTTAGLCQPITTATVVDLASAKEILRKSAPGIDQVTYSSQTSLMSACSSTDGFTCLCTGDISLQTSTCSSFSTIPIVTSLVFTNSSIVAQYSDELRMAAEFPSFNYATQLDVLPVTDLYTVPHFWNLLSAYTFIIVRAQSSTDAPTANTISIINRINSHSQIMSSVFSDQMITILRGNGFYYKYIPQGLKSGGLGDDNYITTDLDTTQAVTIYVYYSRLPDSKPGLITGTTYVFTANANPFSVSVRKSRYSGNTPNLSLYADGAPATNNVSLSNGYVTINKFVKAVGVQVYGNDSSTLTDAYATQRIQNIFYSQSWLYILFFIALYLIFLPLCAIVDCCETEQYMRKKVDSNEHSENKQSEDTTVVKVNYRDFFPLYNVGNTPRPRRLMKVCLFIVNMQHIITFLTLIYFNLPAQQEVAAIALVIPAYLCCVIMGYLVGAVFRMLPGNFKYLINLLSLGYWILWIFVMKIMSNNPSKQYRLFILVFAILSFFLDMVIDALETLLVYFAIKQEEKQVALFNCLARWLSYRGYYQFDKLARQIGAGDNQ